MHGSPSRRLPIARPLLLAVCLAGVALAPACSDVAAGPARRHVLLISIDTLRADALGLYGYERETSPFLDQLGAHGVVFDRHYSNSNTTLPSHASMLTGLFVPAHGVRDGGTDDTRHAIPDGAVTLAERFQEAGYRTIGLTSNAGWLTPAFGFDQGFDVFETSWRDAPVSIDAYLDWMDAEQPERSFAFLHFFDVHSDHQVAEGTLPYEADEPYARRFAGEPPEGFTGCGRVAQGRCGSEYLIAVNEGAEPLPQEHLEYLRGLYDAGIRQLDDQLRGLFGALRERGILEDTLVVVTADHGESFLEHGTLLHSTHHDEVARVPLIIVPPAELDVPPRRVEFRTQSVDVAPTILELAGLEPLGQGRSLAPAVLEGEELPPSDVLFHANVLISQDGAGSFKFVRRGRGARPRFFDHAADPDERVDLAAEPAFVQAQHPRLTAAYQRMVELVRQSQRIHSALGGGESTATSLSPEQVAELRALGYF